MNKFEKLAKLETAYQLIAQVHSDLCNERVRKDGIAESALDLTRDTLMLMDKIRKEIPDDKEICVARHTAYEIGEKIRSTLSSKMLSDTDTFSFYTVERIVLDAVESVWEG